MKIKLITVGKTDASYLNEGIEIYLKRLKHYIPFELEELPDVKNTRNRTADEQKQMEGEKILSKLQPTDYLVLLDERGKAFTSKQFARHLDQKMLQSIKQMVFVIGGPYGFSEEMYQRCNEQMTLSKMTFSHQMVRLFFVEQLYRAMTILKGEPYHHE